MRQVNAPYLGVGVPYTPAVFWLGTVDEYNNYADVRVSYNDSVLAIVVHIIDRRLWYDPTPSPGELPEWDAVSLYLNVDDAGGSAPSLSSYRLEVQLWTNYMTASQGDGSNWTNGNIPFTSWTEWRGASGPNSSSDSDGWVARFYVPFTSLGLVTPPAPNTQWGLALALHDRDDAAGTIRFDTTWPEALDPNVPSTWGQLSFGIPAYAHPNAIASETRIIRQGLNGATVIDGGVGGYTNCGNDGLDKWTTWGSHNYSDPSLNYQFNIQNQWDIADWPCFSKFYVTFPLDAKAPGQVLLSASLTLHLLGTAGGGQYGPPPPSFVEVLTVSQDWQPATLTWNNAPPAQENISGAWVDPVIGAYTWDVSRAADQAFASGVPLRLALYSIDGEYHTGKYFYSSASTEWAGLTRPTLTVVLGDSCDAVGVDCKHVYLPLVRH